jgi:hypothetical protein
MTNEERQLLSKDLYARLPYGVKVRYTPSDYHYPIPEIFTINGINDLYAINIREVNGSQVFDKAKIEDIKPYLRPMSSMTEEEAIKYVTLTHYNTDDNGKPYRELTVEALDWLNANHFDYRGLIPMGLALEASEGMYKIE